MRIDRHHIRTRIALSLVGALAVVLVLYSGAACLLLLRGLRGQLLRHAVQDIETVEGLLYFAFDGRLKLHDDYHNHPESKRVLERLVEVRSPDGTVLFRNEQLGQRSLGDNLIPGEGEGGYSQRAFVLADGERVQMVSRRHAVDGRPTIIRVAYGEQPLRDQFRADLFALVLPLPFVLLLAGAGAYLLASRFLRPIKAMADRAQGIKSDRLHERLPVNDRDGELASLSRAFNTVLVRLEQSFDQLRRFTSDASHELRTPLAAMRSVGEVGLQKHCTADGYRDVIGSMLEETGKLTRLVDSLLTIARADAGQIHLSPSTFAAADLTRECAALFEVLLEEHGQTLGIEGDESVTLKGDRLLLRQALVNIVHNAVKFTPPGGHIALRVRSRNGQAEIEIEDSGPGIPEDQLERIFDRFYRADEVRCQAGGAGLGLAIARWNVEVNGGTVTAHSPRVGGAIFRIQLPCASPELAVKTR